jgi:hypothetical protein
MKSGIIIAVVAITTCLGRGQVTITSQDMFNATGQYYRVYSNPAPTGLAASHYDVTGRLGTNGGPQIWDFTTGPTNVTYRFDYVDPTDGGHGGNFPGAKYAERQTIESTGTAKAWMYLQQVPGTGRRNFGFENPNDDPSEGQFNPAIIDFPDPLKYQSQWTATTTFDSTIQGLLPIRINYTATATVDAYGTIILPGIGSGDCLRVNELDTYETLVDMDMTGNYQTFETDYIRTYYFFRPGHGIVAEILSQQLSSGPPDINFTDASQFTRMFELSHTVAGQGPGAITDLTLNLVNGAALLNWSKTPNTVSYRVEYTPSFSGTNTWQALGTTSSGFFLDASSSTASQRFYRVVSLGQ